MNQHPEIDENINDDQYAFVHFSLGTSQFAIPMSEVQEITEFMQPKLYPLQSAGHIGVINLRGNVIPVYSMEKFLGDSTAESKIISEGRSDSRLIIINCGNSNHLAVVASMVKKISLSSSECSGTIPINGVPVQHLTSEAFLIKAGSEQC